MAVDWTKAGMNWSKWFSKQGKAVGDSADKSMKKAIHKEMR